MRDGRCFIVNVTSCTTDHGAVPSWFRVVSWIANPTCPSNRSILQYIAVYEDSLGILQFEEVFD